MILFKIVINCSVSLSPIYQFLEMMIILDPFGKKRKKTILEPFFKENYQSISWQKKFTFDRNGIGIPISFFGPSAQRKQFFFCGPRIPLFLIFQRPFQYIQVNCEFVSRCSRNGGFFESFASKSLSSSRCKNSGSPHLSQSLEINGGSNRAFSYFTHLNLHIAIISFKMGIESIPQCRNLNIFLSFRFYVESNLVTL